jgi:hypothetical protein
LYSLSVLDDSAGDVGNFFRANCLNAWLNFWYLGSEGKITANIFCPGSNFNDGWGALSSGCAGVLFSESGLGVIEGSVGCVKAVSDSGVDVESSK